MELFLLMITLAVLNNGGPENKMDNNAPTPERLTACPKRPNCVSSRARDAKHAVAPLHLDKDIPAGWAALRRIVASLTRCRIVTATDRYLHATCKSRLFGFTDDLELLLDPATGVVDVRSASRVGYADLGVNRRRVEALRNLLEQQKR